MKTLAKQQSAQCACGKNQFTLFNNALLRVICHCEICQQFNEAPYADILIFNAKDVELPENHSVEFKAYTNPPMVQRGKCKDCHKPAIELLDMPMAPALRIIPVGNLVDKQSLPKVDMHSFYHRRIVDVDDGAPKYSGFIKSQGMFMLKLFSRKIFSQK